jgi:hypothetical protein
MSLSSCSRQVVGDRVWAAAAALPSAPSTADEWTWMRRSSTASAKGIYGTLGVASSSNVPGARSGSVSWLDSSGIFWFYGAVGYGSGAMTTASRTKGQ